MFLRISPTRGVVRFGRRNKLSPQFIGPFEVLQQVGECTYRLALPPNLFGVHDVFHVSMLRKYIPDLTTVEWPVAIVDREERVLRNRAIPFVKVVWQYHGGDSAT